MIVESSKAATTGPMIDIEPSRIIDTQRAGGTGNAASKAAVAAPEMTFAEALEYDAKFRWRSLPTKSDRARRALIAEVERAEAELARFRAALLEVVGCVCGNGVGCTLTGLGHGCCARLASIRRAGLLPATGAKKAAE